MANIQNFGFNQMNSMGCCPSPYGGGGDSFMMAQQMMQMMSMMQMMMGMMQMMGGMQGGGFNPMMMNPMMMNPGGFPQMGPQMGNYMGNMQQYSPMPFPSFPGPCYPQGPQYGNGCMPMPGCYRPGGNSGSAAVNLGQQFIGQNSIDIRGRMPNFTAAGGQTNNCADFVSSALESTGGLQGHHVGVRGLEQALLRQGYRRIPASQARPGDVWMNPSRGHTELVATPGATQLLGSNNDRPGHQVISQKPNRNPDSGIYYSRG